jgi:hypothetical protein
MATIWLPSRWLVVRAGAEVVPHWRGVFFVHRRINVSFPNAALEDLNLHEYDRFSLSVHYVAILNLISPVSSSVHPWVE